MKKSRRVQLTILLVFMQSSISIAQTIKIDTAGLVTINRASYWGYSDLDSFYIYISAESNNKEYKLEFDCRIERGVTRNIDEELQNETFNYKSMVKLPLIYSDSLCVFYFDDCFVDFIKLDSNIKVYLLIKKGENWILSYRNSPIIKL